MASPRGLLLVHNIGPLPEKWIPIGQSLILKYGLYFLIG